MDQTTTKLQGGINRLPQVYNATVAVGADPPVRVTVTTSPLLGTTPSEPRDPRAPTVAFPMDWPNALRLAHQIVKMARATNQPEPDWLSEPTAGLTLITTDHTPGQTVSVSQPQSLDMVFELFTAKHDNGAVCVRTVNGRGEVSESFFPEEGIPTLIEALQKYA